MRIISHKSESTSDPRLPRFLPHRERCWKPARVTEIFRSTKMFPPSRGRNALYKQGAGNALREKQFLGPDSAPSTCWKQKFSPICSFILAFLQGRACERQSITEFFDPPPCSFSQGRVALLIKRPWERPIRRKNVLRHRSENISLTVLGEDPFYWAPAHNESWSRISRRTGAPNWRATGKPLRDKKICLRVSHDRNQRNFVIVDFNYRLDVAIHLHEVCLYIESREKRWPWQAH